MALRFPSLTKFRAKAVESHSSFVHVKALKESGNDNVSSSTIVDERMTDAFKRLSAFSAVTRFVELQPKGVTSKLKDGLLSPNTGSTGVSVGDQATDLNFGNKVPTKPGDLGNGTRPALGDSRLMVGAGSSDSGGTDWCEQADWHRQANESWGMERELGADGSLGRHLAGMYKEWKCEQQKEADTDNGSEGTEGADSSDEAAAEESSETSSTEPEKNSCEPEDGEEDTTTNETDDESTSSETTSTEPEKNSCEPEDADDGTSTPMPDDDGTTGGTISEEEYEAIVAEARESKGGLVNPGDPDSDTNHGTIPLNLDAGNMARSRLNPYINPTNEEGDGSVMPGSRTNSGVTGLPFGGLSQPTDPDGLVPGMDGAGGPVLGDRDDD